MLKKFEKSWEKSKSKCCFGRLIYESNTCLIRTLLMTPLYWLLIYPLWSKVVWLLIGFFFSDPYLLLRGPDRILWQMRQIACCWWTRTPTFKFQTKKVSNYNGNGYKLTKDNYVKLYIDVKKSNAQYENVNVNTLKFLNQARQARKVVTLHLLYVNGTMISSRRRKKWKGCFMETDSPTSCEAQPAIERDCKNNDNTIDNDSQVSGKQWTKEATTLRRVREERQE